MHIPSVLEGALMTTYTDRPWWTVGDAAKLLRVNVNTLYQACAREDFPHNRWDNGYISIPAEAMGLTPIPVAIRGVEGPEVIGQLELPFDKPIMPIKVYRNTGRPVRVGDYELSLSINRRWRNA